jgi:hypothetical protein
MSSGSMMLQCDMGWLAGILRSAVTDSVEFHRGVTDVTQFSQVEIQL